MEPIITSGTYIYEPQLRKDRVLTPDGMYPRRYWDVYFPTDEQDAIEYRNSLYEPEPEPARPEPARPEPEPEHKCATCKRTCNTRYKVCYRCNQFELKKARIRKELSA